MYIRPWQAVLILVAISFVLAAAAVPAATWPTSATFSLASGVAALTLMAAAAVLGGRWSLVESAFGGLDRVFRAHKWLGIWALALASFHMVFKADLDGWSTASILELSPYYTRLVRQLAFVALMFIVILALNRNIPYNVWRWWHKLSGPLFLLVILHWLSFKSPIALASPAGVWLAAASLLGVASAAYKLLLYPFLAQHAEYQVVELHPGDNAIHLQLMPVKRVVQFQPGQFGFLRMKQEGMWEPHPFTIASGTSADGRVDFVIRALGDYTRKLATKTTIGMRADIYAPYGRFRRPTQAQREIWIGGGVGISPFISWLQDESAGGFDRVTLFYFYTPGREFPNVTIMEDMARQRGAELIPVTDGPSSPAFTERFAAIARQAGPAAVKISFCGPKGLLQQVRRQMRQHGIPDANLQHELFEFR